MDRETKDRLGVLLAEVAMAIDVHAIDAHRIRSGQMTPVPVL